MNLRAKAGDIASFNGNPMPFIGAMHLQGNFAAYVGNLDKIWVPASMEVERHGWAAAITDYQVHFGTAGVGGTGNDVLRLQLIDQADDVAGAGTVSTSGTAVTGIGTSFLTFFQVGGYIRSTGNTFKIGAIADATHLTLEAAPAVDWSGAAYFKVPTLATLATITIAANKRFVAPVDLRNLVNLQGIKLLPGQGVRLDSAGGATGYTTAPANVRIRLGMGAFSLAG